MKNPTKFWDRQSKSYDKLTDNYDASYKRILEKTGEYLGKAFIVLDYACGTGNISIALAPTVKTIYAIDTSTGMLQLAEKKAKDHKIHNILFFASDIHDEKLIENSFDAVLAINILHLLKDTNQVIKRIHFLLKPGGVFISSTACLGDEKKLRNTFIRLLSKIGIVPFMKVLKSSELKRSISRGNFQIQESEDLNYSPPNFFIIANKLI